MPVPLNKSVALVGVDGWADGLGGEGPATKARINDFYQILDFATEPEPQVFRQMKESARKYSQALKPSLIRALKQYQTTIIATLDNQTIDGEEKSKPEVIKLGLDLHAKQVTECRQLDGSTPKRLRSSGIYGS